MNCTVCGRDQESELFPLNGDGKGGRRKQCKECMRSINHQWREKNKEKIKQYNQNRRKPDVPPVVTENVTQEGQV